MRARVVEDRQWTGLLTAIGASIVSAIGAYGLGESAREAALVYYPNPPGKSWPDDAVLAAMAAREPILSAFFAAGAFVLVVAAVMPWIVVFRRPRAHEVKLGDGTVRIGPTALAAATVTGASVAVDGGGASIAIAEGESTTFLEVDRVDDARPILAALKRPFPASGKLGHALPERSLLLPIAAVGLLDLVTALLVPLAGREGHMETIPFAIAPAVVLIAALTILRARARMKVTWGAERLPPTRALSRSPIERHVRRHVEDALTAEPARPRARLDLLERGVADVKTWLAKIDALGRDASYRTGALPDEVLTELVEDAHVAIDVRLAAARLLRRRGDQGIATRIADEDVRVRISAAVEADIDTSARRLEEIGVFKTEAR